MSQTFKFWILVIAIAVSSLAAFAQVTVQAPWKVDGKLPSPKNGAVLTCALLDKNCNPTNSNGVPVGVNAGAGGKSSGTETMSLSGPSDAVGVQCSIRAPGLQQTSASTNTQPIPGKTPACMVNAGGKWKGLDPAALQKLRTERATEQAALRAAAKGQRNSERAAQDAEDKRTIEANKRLQEATHKRNAALKAAYDARRNKALKAPSPEELALRKKAFDEARRDLALIEQERNMRGHPMSCGSWCASVKGKCIAGGDGRKRCLERENRNLNPDSSPCQVNTECDNISYQGVCRSIDAAKCNKKINPHCRACVSEERPACKTPGRLYPCASASSPMPGVAQCRKDGRLGSCQNDYASYKKSRVRLNDPASAWVKSRPGTIQTTSLNPEGSPCTSNSQCNNLSFQGQCIKSKCINVEKRESCQSDGQTKLCFTKDGRQTAGIAVCSTSKPYNGVYKDCVSKPEYHKDYHDVIAKYLDDKSSWEKVVSLSGYSATTLDTEDSPCSARYECSNKSFVGYCDTSRPKLGSTGTCSKTTPRDGCKYEGAMQACVEPSAAVGMQRCTKIGGDLKWGDCFSGGRIQKAVDSMKKQGKL